MTFVLLSLSIAVFVVMLRALRAQEVASNVVATAQDAVVTIAHPDLTDEQKEAKTRRAAFMMFRSFFAIMAISIVAAATAAVIVWGGAAAGLYPLDQAIATATGWPFILAASAGSVALWLLLARDTKPAAEVQDVVPYSPLDQAMHDFALSSLSRQRRLARVEDRLFARTIRKVDAGAPVFITSLPRAGTTMMLNLLADLPEFSSATYRHMPFTLAPLLWGEYSRAFRRAGALVERSHGDGIGINVESPEAFEEMAWMAFWPEHYRGQTIRPWTDGDAKTDQAIAFRDFMERHMRKIVAAKGKTAHRYVSKNNANVARLPFISRIFPEATVIVPLRDPWAQIASMRRQHRRFSDLHAQEPFAQRYMQRIGHLEFGAALKPIGFEGFDPDLASPDSSLYWTAYWIAAYEAILANASPGTVFVDHDALSADPSPQLTRLAQRLHMPDAEPLVGLADRLHPTHPVRPPEDLPADVMEHAADLHASLLRRAADQD